MWKKDETPQTVSDTPRKKEEAAPIHPPAPTVTPTGGRAAIGRSITIRGEVTGDEDLLIEGRVDGSVDLKQHAVTVGSGGQVKAGINGRIVTVEGTVEGDLVAVEQVVLRSSARVVGDITAPRVVLEDGATFRGGVEMGDRPRETGQGSDGKRDRQPAPPGESDKPSSASPAAVRAVPGAKATQGAS